MITYNIRFIQEAKQQMAISQQILAQLQTYTIYSQQKLLQLLMNLDIPQGQQTSFNQQFQSQIINTLKSLMERQQIQNICSLLNLIWKSLKNKQIKKNVLITILDSVLECIGIEDLKQILEIIWERVGQMRDILADVQYQLLRIINTLLKRISKTTDFHVRGQLHLTITRIINFCHQSGFQYRPSTHNNINSKIQLQQGLLDNFNQSNLSMEFYEDFWQLQKYFMDIQLLNKNDKENNKTQNKQDNKLIPNKLKRIQIIMENVISYLKVHQAIQHKNFMNFPLKFLKLPNLLVLQLQDSYFRLIILVQTMIFCASLKIFPNKYQIQITSQSKQIIEKLQKKVIQAIQEILNKRTDAENLISMMNYFLKNDAYWIQLKDNWKEKKKTFFKTTANEQVVQIKKINAVPQSANAQQNQSNHYSKKPLNLAQISQSCRTQIQNKIGIKSEYIQNFLKHMQAPVLKKQPISPSFAYFYNQAKQCSDSFDQKQQVQTQFQSRSQYNLFQWKAFRSLQRQRIVTGMETDKNGSKFSEYRLLDFIKRKQQLLQGQPRKRVKLSEEDKVDDY